MELDVTALRGRRAVHRWDRPSVGVVLERLTWSRPDDEGLTGAPGAYGDDAFARLTYSGADHAIPRRAAEGGSTPATAPWSTTTACGSWSTATRTS
jgi:hypothetical protein